jgi:hypothetical protein
MDKEISMPIPTNPIDDVRMESADNGVIICYSEKRKTGNGKYDNYTYDYKKEVFDFDEEEDSKEAFDRFKELFMAMKKSKKK